MLIFKFATLREVASSERQTCILKELQVSCAKDPVSKPLLLIITITGNHLEIR